MGSEMCIRDSKNGSITAKDIKKNTLTGKQVKDGSLGKADLAAGTLPTVSLKRLAATPGASLAAAQAAAPRLDLFSKGDLTVYAKCYTDTSGPTTYASVFVRSTSSFGIFDGDNDELSGGPALTDFLGPATLESDRIVQEESASANDVSFQGEGDTEFTAITGAGTGVIQGDVAVGAKNGTLAAGDGPYGAGDACLFASQFVSN